MWGLHTSESRLPSLHTGDQLESYDICTELNLDYGRRLRHALLHGRKRPQYAFLRWLHIPKTGTSFVNTIIRWGCPAVSPHIFITPRKERPGELGVSLNETLSWDWFFLNHSGRAWLQNHCDGRLVTTHPSKRVPHFSLCMHRAVSHWEIPHTAAIFRLPLQRVYSNYMHLSLHYNESRTPRQSLSSFVSKPQFASQQTKLLLGRHYRDKRPVTTKEALQAAAIVTNRLRFVGLTEEFELSSRLFHAKFGGVPHRSQFENVRPGISRYKTKVGRSGAFRYDEALFQGWRDSADEIVYHAARRRFWREVRAMRNEIELDGLNPVVLWQEYL